MKNKHAKYLKTQHIGALVIASIAMIPVISCSSLEMVGSSGAETQERTMLNGMINTLKVSIDDNIESRYTFTRLDSFLRQGTVFSAEHVAFDLGLPHDDDGIDYGYNLPNTIRPKFFDFDINKYSLVYTIIDGDFIEGSNSQKIYKVQATITSKTFKDMNATYVFNIKSVNTKDFAKIELKEVAESLIFNIFDVRPGEPGYVMPSFTSDERFSRILSAYAANNQLISREKFKNDLGSLFRPSGEEVDRDKYLFNLPEEDIDAIIGINKHLFYRVKDEGIVGSGISVSHKYKIQFVIQKTTMWGSYLTSYPIDFSKDECVFELIVKENFAAAEEVTMLYSSLIKLLEGRPGWKPGKEFGLSSEFTSDILNTKKVSDPWSNFVNAPHIAQISNGTIEDTLASGLGIVLSEDDIKSLTFLPGLKISFTIGGHSEQESPDISSYTYQAWFKIFSSRTDYAMSTRIVIYSKDKDAVEISAVVEEVDAKFETLNDKDNPLASTLDKDVISTNLDLDNWPSAITWAQFETNSGIVGANAMQGINTNGFDVNILKPTVVDGTQGAIFKVKLAISKTGKNSAPQETIELQFQSSDYLK